MIKGYDVYVREKKLLHENNVRSSSLTLNWKKELKKKEKEVIFIKIALLKEVANGRNKT
jgi:hypothetical protein